MNNKPQSKLNFIWVVFTALAFGSMEVSIKLAGAAFTPLQLTFLRFLIGGLVLLPFAQADLKKRQVRLTASDWRYLLLLGVVGVCFSMSLFNVGVSITNANLSAMIISSSPVFTMIFAAWMLGETFTKRKALVVAMCLTGLVIFANPFSAASKATLLGPLLIFAATIGFALYTVLGKKRVAKIGGLAQNAYSFLLACVVQLVLLLVTGQPVFSGITGANLPILLYISFVVTGFGYYCFLRAIATMGAGNASLAFFLKPIVATLLAALILGESITWNVVLGIALVLTGSALNFTHPQQSVNAPQTNAPQTNAASAEE